MKRITQKDWQNLYVPLTEETKASMLEHIRAGMQEKDDRRAKPPKVVLALALALLLSLVVTGTLAATGVWDVRQFLSEFVFNGALPQQAVPYASDVFAQAKGMHTTVSVRSAYWDGIDFAMDWTVVNEQPEQPVYLKIESFTLNGEAVSTDGNDDFDNNWLPNIWCPDGVWEGGERIRAPETMQGQNECEVELHISVWQPTAPVVILHTNEDGVTFDTALAEEKLAEGFYPIVDWDGFLFRDPEEGLICVYGGNVPEGCVGEFEHKELTISFTLHAEDIEKTVLTPAQAQWENELFTSCITKAEQTPLGFTLCAEIMPKDGTQETLKRLFDLKIELADSEGNTLADAFNRTYESGSRQTADGRWYMAVEITWSPDAEVMIPSELALVIRAGDGLPQDLMMMVSAP